MSLGGDEDGKETLRPRETLPIDFIERADFIAFNELERSSVHQITQHLTFLGEEKARILVNILAKIEGYGL